MTVRLVIVVEGGFVQDVCSDLPADVDVRIVDFDAKEFAEDDDRASLVDGTRAWITGYDVILDSAFVSSVFAGWD